MEKGLGTPTGVNSRIEQVIRLGGFLVPVLLIIYGVCILLGAVPTPARFSQLAFVVISSLWLLLSMWQFLAQNSSRSVQFFRLALYHILSVAYIMLVSGFDMPFIGCWVILFFASYIYLGKRGLIASELLLFLVAAADILFNVTDPTYVTRVGLYFLAIIVVGQITGTIAAAEAVDRRELSRSQAEELLQRDRILTIVNNLADAVLSTDNNGIIQVYNAACLNLLDTNSELTGQPVDSIVRINDKDSKPFRFVRAFRTARSVEMREDLSAVISGETVHLSVIYSPIRSTNSHPNAKSDGYIIILRDITKQKSLEEERDEFISVVSHELRTPITIAEGSLSNVQVMMSRDDIPKATLAENVKLSHDQVLFLAKMVNDLSTLSRAERGVADAPEEIDVSSLIHDLYSEYAPQAEAKGLHFNLDLSPQLGSVTASRLYLKELLQNFVTNAIKYTKKGEIVVSVKKHDDELTFAVKDSGIGISKSDQQHIFERFWRSEDYRTRETGGTGLGLYVSRKLAKKLNVQIEMKSRLNHGSTFSFVMPFHDTPTEK